MHSCTHIVVQCCSIIVCCCFFSYRYGLRWKLQILTYPPLPRSVRLLVQCGETLIQRRSSVTTTGSTKRRYSNIRTLFVPLCRFFFDILQSEIPASEGWRGAWQPYSKGNQKPLVIKDKLGRSPGELGMSKSMECATYSLWCFDTIGWATETAPTM